MQYSDDDLNDIYDRTSGYCHICHKKLSFKNYGLFGVRGCWEVEHSNPRKNGGTHRKNNLYAACIKCNRSKGVASTKKVRAKNGKRKAPLSIKKRKNKKIEQAIAGGTLGAVAGSVFGPWGAVIGGTIGANLGHRKNPDR